MIGMFRRMFKGPRICTTGLENAWSKKNQHSTRFGHALKVSRNSGERLKEKTAYQWKKEHEKTFEESKHEGKNNDLLKSVVKKAPILSLDEAKSFLERKRYLLSTPNVVSLGFSNERVDGKKTGGKIFRVGVIKKQPKEKIKQPDIFIPKFFKHIIGSSSEVVIPVNVVEEGELTFNADHTESRNADPGDNDGPYKGGSLIKNIDLPFVGCLGVNTDYGGSYRLLSAAHVLTTFDRGNIGKEIEVKNSKGDFVKIGATVSGQVDVELYDSPHECKPKYATQDLAWADITTREGSPEIKEIGIPNDIRKVEIGERVKYYAGESGVVGRRVKVLHEEKKLEIDDPIAETKIRVKTTSGIKYAYFIDICRIEPSKKLKYGDSGTAIVAEEDNALLGILMSVSKDWKSYYFSKLKV